MKLIKKYYNQLKDWWECGNAAITENDSKHNLCIVGLEQTNKWWSIKEWIVTNLIKGWKV